MADKDEIPAAVFLGLPLLFGGPHRNLFRHINKDQPRFSEALYSLPEDWSNLGPPGDGKTDFMILMRVRLPRIPHCSGPARRSDWEPERIQQCAEEHGRATDRLIRETQQRSGLIMGRCVQQEPTPKKEVRFSRPALTNFS
jgi:hypothetical protein